MILREMSELKFLIEHLGKKDRNEQFESLLVNGIFFDEICLCPHVWLCLVFHFEKKRFIHVRVYDFIISLAGALIHKITGTDV